MKTQLNADLYEMKKDLNRIKHKQGIYKGISNKTRKELLEVAMETITTLEGILFFENDLRV